MLVQIIKNKAVSIILLVGILALLAMKSNSSEYATIDIAKYSLGKVQAVVNIKGQQPDTRTFKQGVYPTKVLEMVNEMTELGYELVATDRNGINTGTNTMVEYRTLYFRK